MKATFEYMEGGRIRVEISSENPAEQAVLEMCENDVPPPSINEEDNLELILDFGRKQ